MARVRAIGGAIDAASQDTRREVPHCRREDETDNEGEGKADAGGDSYQQGEAQETAMKSDGREETKRKSPKSHRTLEIYISPLAWPH